MTKSVLQDGRTDGDCSLRDGADLVVEEPAHVAPPEALVRGVGIHGRVCVQMVVSVTAGPLNRVSLHMFLIVGVIITYQQCWVSWLLCCFGLSLLVAQQTFQFLSI